jgi:hypothetical protein
MSNPRTSTGSTTNSASGPAPSIPHLSVSRFLCYRRLVADCLTLFVRTITGLPSTEKEASVTVAFPRSMLSVGILMLSAVSDKRTEVAALRAPSHQPAVSFTLTAHSPVHRY